MKLYDINHLIIDDDFASEEYVTVDFTHNHKEYSITFKKADLEIMNSWVFQDGTSLPADLSVDLIESIREDVKKKI
ncbi:hypothetical protein [Neobacillus ginsengisoli]|uniref:Uncharacterized protein n=1 Tax=Neobacillus ginsengisoli TaxID=904295 RepID=A0ABT9XX25_9BACI|nr:hypothetical protein [Neobacillus ginsengisoli]MDQ0199437.1 hypothetical protein [Neobacillus ginsengisoli]